MKPNNNKKIKFVDCFYLALCQAAVHLYGIGIPVIDPELNWKGEVDGTQ